MGNANTYPTNLLFNVVESKSAAQRMLERAEQSDFYLDTCRIDPLNAKARRHQVYAANSISATDRDYYQAGLSKMISSIPLRLKMDLHTVYIVPLMMTADGGMPHTRPDSMICVSRLPQLTSLTTINHELWHIHQRNYKDLWRKVFEKLGWVEWMGLLPGFLEKNRRVNPDTIDAPLWIFQDTWIPVPVFRDISLPDLTEVDVWFYHVRDGYHVKKVPEELASMFPNVPSSSYEHPRELAAYILSEHEKHRGSPALESLLSTMGRLSIIS